MNRTRLVMGSVVALIGLVFFLQGIGLLGGSAMTGETLWVVVGALMVLAGLILAWSGRRT